MKYKTVNFEVIELWYNDIYTPYTLQPLTKKSTKEYAIKIEDSFFLLGDPKNSLYICNIDE